MSNLSRPLAFTAVTTPNFDSRGFDSRNFWSRRLPDGSCCSDCYFVLVLFALQADFHLLFLSGQKNPDTGVRGLPLNADETRRFGFKTRLGDSLIVAMYALHALMPFLGMQAERGDRPRFQTT